MRSAVEYRKKIDGNLLRFNRSISDGEPNPVEHMITVSLNQKLRTGRDYYLGEERSNFRLTTWMEVSFRAVDNDRAVRGSQQSGNEQRKCIRNAVADIRGPTIFAGCARPEFEAHQIGSGIGKALTSAPGKISPVHAFS